MLKNIEKCHIVRGDFTKRKIRYKCIFSLCDNQDFKKYNFEATERDTVTLVTNPMSPNPGYDFSFSYDYL